MGVKSWRLFPLGAAAGLGGHPEIRRPHYAEKASINAMILCCLSLCLRGPFKSWVFKETIAKFPSCPTSILPRLSAFHHGLGIARAVGMKGMLGRRFMVVGDANMWNPQTLKMSMSLHADFLIETSCTRGPCLQVNEKEIAYLGKPLPNSPGIIKPSDHIHLIL